MKDWEASARHSASLDRLSVIRCVTFTRMRSPRNRTTPRIELSSVLTIAFTGHRKLTDEARCRDAIRKVLEEWKSKAPGTVYGLSSAAAGGDLLFTETCIELGLPIRILLPLPREQFSDDFDAGTWQRVERVLNCAFSVEVVGASQDRSERYYECGIETVQQSRLLIALWDGEPARGLSGGRQILFASPNVRADMSFGSTARPG
jgi:hypothetical protein